MDETENITDLIHSVKGQVVTWRRYLHQYPELSFQEENTSQFVWETLQSFPDVTVSRPTKTSVVADLAGRKPGGILAMRSDMDALPIEEKNTFHFVSQKPGVMHACGHDGHTAMLLGAAKILSHIRDQLNGSVRFIFQHAEELPPGGAEEIVKKGVLNGIDAVIGLHLSSAIQTGKIGITDGVLSASLGTFHIKVVGEGGHSSLPHTTIDPITIGSEVVTNLQQIVSRNISSGAKAVVSVSNIHGGTTINVTPESIRLDGTVRTFDEMTRMYIPVLMERIVKGITEAHGADYRFYYEDGYASVVNDKEITANIQKGIGEALGKDSIQQLEQGAMMGSEDFSAFSQKVPGCFLLVGAGNEQKGITYPHHHSKFNFDEEALEHGLKILVHAPFYLNS